MTDPQSLWIAFITGGAIGTTVWLALKWSRRPR
jgi:hypothetical protein